MDKERAETIVLVKRAKQGDREAWTLLVEGYYSQWQRQLHKRLHGGTCRVYETQDLIQSAIREALERIGDLKSDAAFFSWVSAIARCKHAQRAREERRARTVDLDEELHAQWLHPDSSAQLVTQEEYERVLKALTDLFPTYPEPMTAVYLKHFEKLEIGSIARRLGKSERSAHRFVDRGLDLLRSRLGGSSAKGKET